MSNTIGLQAIDKLGYWPFIIGGILILIFWIGYGICVYIEKNNKQ